MRISPRIAVPRILVAVLATALVAGVVPMSAASERATTDITVTVAIDERRVVPIGIDRGADWGDVILESGTATAKGIGKGTFLRRGMAFGTMRLGTQDTFQMSFPTGDLVFQGDSFWYGATEVALLGGTGDFTGVRGSATVTLGDGTQQWTISILPQRGVDPTRTTVMEYPRELLSTSRITLAPEGSTVGNLTQTMGVLVGEGDRTVADYTAISTVVQDMPDNRERRLVQAMFAFQDDTDYVGNIFVNAIIVAERGALPTAPVSYAISGGTGIYAGAAGIAEYVPGNGTAEDRWRFTLFALTDTATPVPIKAATQVETRYTQVRTSGTATGGVGDLVLAGGWWRSGKAERDHWAVSAQAVDIEAGRESVRRTLLATLQYSQGPDRILVLGLTRTGTSGGPAAPVERVVIGGLGAYAGASGTSTMTPVKPRQWRTTFAVSR